MSKGLKESVVEDAALDWLRELSYEVLSGLAIAPGGPAAERTDYKQAYSAMESCHVALQFQSQRGYIIQPKVAGERYLGFAFHKLFYPERVGSFAVGG